MKSSEEPHREAGRAAQPKYNLNQYLASRAVYIGSDFAKWFCNGLKQRPAWISLAWTLLNQMLHDKAMSPQHFADLPLADGCDSCSSCSLPSLVVRDTRWTTTR